MANYFQLHKFRPGFDPAAGTCAAVGFFDGVHKGHAFLMEQTKKEAASRSLQPLAVSFVEHPRLAVSGSRYWPELLTTNPQKLALLAATGIDACALLRFDHAMSMLTSEEFMQTVLRESLGVRCLIVGYDHHFGSDLSSGFADYVRSGRRLGIDVVRARAFEENDLKISSSATRRFLSGGNVEAACACLGRPYRLEGTVVEGHHEGRALGFPTANLRPDCEEQLVPGRGVYAVRATVDGFTYPAMLNIGWRPTLDNGSDRTIETHLLDYDGGALYGRRLAIEFLRRIRDEHRFESIEALSRQLAVDAANVRDYFNSL